MMASRRRALEEQIKRRIRAEDARRELRGRCRAGWLLYNAGDEDGRQLGRVLTSAFDCIDALEKRIRELEGKAS